MNDIIELLRNNQPIPEPAREIMAVNDHRKTLSAVCQARKQLDLTTRQTNTVLYQRFLDERMLGELVAGSCRTNRNIAQSLGVSEQTLYRWKRIATIPDHAVDTFFKAYQSGDVLLSSEDVDDFIKDNHTPKAKGRTAKYRYCILEQPRQQTINGVEAVVLALTGPGSPTSQPDPHKPLPEEPAKIVVQDGVEGFLIMWGSARMSAVDDDAYAAIKKLRSPCYYLDKFHWMTDPL